MKYLLLALIFFTTVALAADVPEATAEFRAQHIKEYAPSCIEALDGNPKFRVAYSKKTIEAYCACSQRYQADVYSAAIKADKRGKTVGDEASEYASKKCSRILIEKLERE
jgi:hypothetical protein